MNSSDDQLLAELKAFEGRVVGPAQVGPDEVNQAMIRHWCEAIGDDNPIYTDPQVAASTVHGGLVAPPAMLQAWVMRGVRPRPSAEGNLQDQLMSLLDDAGYASVVATNCEQEYHRYLRPGDRLIMESVIESISERKQTALGPGYFVTTRSEYRDATGELVGTMRFRVLKFKPGVAGRERASPAARRPRPAITQDNAFFFEGAREGKLLIQRCSGCGRLRHPPRPACAHCGSLDWDTIESSGRGHVYSFVINHHPQVPGFEYPLVVVLVELEEGTRLVSNLLGVGRDQVRIGMPVVAEMVEVDDQLTLPMFRPAGAGGS